MNQKPKRNGITISIRDMLLYVLSHWKALIICLAAGALLLSVYSGYKGMKDQKNNIPVSVEEKKESLEGKLTDGEKATAVNNAKAIIQNLNQYESLTLYNEKSLFQQLDPKNVKTDILTYAVAAADAQTLADNEKAGIAYEYVNGIYCDELAKNISKEFGISEEESFYYYDNTVLSEYVGEDPGTGLFAIRIFNEDEEFLGKMANAVRMTVEHLNREISNKSLSHEAKLVGEVVAASDGQYVYETQMENADNIKAVTTSLKNIFKNITGNAADYTECLVRETYEGDYLSIAYEDINSSQTEPEFVLSKKKMLLGGIAGLVICAIVLIIIYLHGGKLRCYDDMEYIYDIPVLGTVDEAVNRKKLGIDRSIHSLRTKHKKQSYEDSVRLAANKLMILAKNNSVSNICVAVNAKADVDEKLILDIAAKCEGLSITFAKDILRNADAAEKIRESQAVVLAEQMDRSKFALIDEECRLCSANNINICGAIVIQ